MSSGLAAAVLVLAMHASLQHTDPPAQQTSDAARIFTRAAARGVWWVTGTETNPAVRPAATAHGYRYVHLGGDVWTAINTRRIQPGTLSAGWHKDIPGVAHRHPARGVLRVSFRNPRIGWVTVLSAHYDLPDASNRPIAADISRQARWYGRGRRLVFTGLDTNMHLRHRNLDPFFGAPLTTSWAELRHYEWTHPGPETIDTVASYDRDTRVAAAWCHAAEDTVFPLHTDHYPVTAGYRLQPLPLARLREASA